MAAVEREADDAEDRHHADDHEDQCGAALVARCRSVGKVTIAAH